MTREKTFMKDMQEQQQKAVWKSIACNMELVVLSALCKIVSDNGCH